MEINKKIWWILIIVVVLVLGIWLYSIGLKSSKKVSEKKAGKRPEIFQGKETERVIVPKAAEPIKIRKPMPPSRKKVVIPSDYEPVSPEREGIKGFAEERRQQEKLKDRGIPTG